MFTLIRKSIAASMLISLGVYVLLTLGNPLGPFLFALGLLGVCVMELNLFTGKCGFFIESKIPLIDLVLILIVNLLSGYVIGYIISYMNADLVQVATEKVATWSFTVPFFLKSVACGVIMYICVYLYKKGTKLGILFGIPLFILCGFQHCIANIITMGVAHTFHNSLYICVLGNFLGSIFIWYISTNAKLADVFREYLSRY